MMDMVTLGSFVLDDIYLYPPVRQPLYGIVGGAGPYAAVAARMFNPGERSTRVGLILHEGGDFPKIAREQIEALKMHAKFIDRPCSNTTRGSNVYDADGNRNFAFISPNVKIHASMLDEVMLTSKTYHMICTPSRCIDLCKEILAAREKLFYEQPSLKSHLSTRALIVWEPMEDSCHPSEIQSFKEALEYVDVFSPNQRELLALCGMEARPGPDLDVQTVRFACKKLLNGTSQRAIVARCGEHGCVIIEIGHSDCLQFPAYHKPLPDPKNSATLRPPKSIVDVTGGGNAFLGGFCAALSSGFSVEDFTAYEAAALYGNVAASYAIEQLGVPQLRVSEGKELWNGSSPFLRLAELMQRLENKDGQHRGLRASNESKDCG